MSMHGGATMYNMYKFSSFSNLAPVESGYDFRCCRNLLTILTNVFEIHSKLGISAVLPDIHPWNVVLIEFTIGNQATHGLISSDISKTSPGLIPRV